MDLTLDLQKMTFIVPKLIAFDAGNDVRTVSLQFIDRGNMVKIFGIQCRIKRRTQETQSKNCIDINHFIFHKKMQ